MKKKGFTLVELLVVIAIIAMLLAILMPALGKVRQLAQRMVCSSNLAGIGKAMLVYTNDDKNEQYPLAATGTVYWAMNASGKEGVDSWDWSNKLAPGVTGQTGSSPYSSTISACLYLLVRIADVSPDNFICGGGEEKKFDLSQYDKTTTDATYTDVWDFGNGEGAAKKILSAYSRGRGHNSYSYQAPFALSTGYPLAFPITTTSNPSRAVAADRNPFWDLNRTDEGLMAWDETDKILPTEYPKGNATAHQRDGQNVLFADGHTQFAKGANCGIESDNIYTTWGLAANASLPGTATGPTGANAIRQVGGTTPPTTGTTPGSPGVQNAIQNVEDSYLVNEFN